MLHVGQVPSQELTMSSELVDDEFEEAFGGGRLVIRIAGAQLLRRDRTCILDVIHEGQRLLLQARWLESEYDGWESPNAQLYAQWPHFFRPSSPVRASPFAVALVRVAASVRDGRAPDFPVDLTEEEAIALSHHKLEPSDLSLRVHRGLPTGM